MKILIAILSTCLCSVYASLSEPASCIKTDVSKIETLKGIYFFADGYKCLRCNEQGRVELFQNKNPQEAYTQFKKGMLGTGESEYSILLTQHFNECLEEFCKHEIVDDYIDKFNVRISEIKKIVICPDYYPIRIALSDLIHESEEKGDLFKNVSFYKEMIFFIMLEDTQNDYISGDEGHRDYYLSLEKRVSKNVRKLRSLIASFCN
jgi:hypothetical protein